MFLCRKIFGKKKYWVSVSVLVSDLKGLGLKWSGLGRCGLGLEWSGLGLG